MGYFSLVLGIIVAVVVLAAAIRLQQSRPNRSISVAAGVIALAALIFGALLSSVRYVGAGEVGIIKRNALGPRLEGGAIIATQGEMGVQADVLPPGWHLGYWPVVYDLENVPLTRVADTEVGIIETRDGLPLDEGQLFAHEYPRDTFQQMLQADYFLTTGQGRKGPQASVLTPGSYRLNTELYTVRMVPQTNVPAANVAVLKANFGTPASIRVAGGEGDDPVFLADEGERGVRALPLLPGRYPLNPEAYEVVEVSTRDTIVQYVASEQLVRGQQRGAVPAGGAMGEDAITVRTSDGFTFPVDVRVEYRINPEDAPLLVATLGDDDDNLLNKLTSAVRAIFRNNAEGVKALDYVQQRSQQEAQSTRMLAQEMASVGVTITAVRIGNVGDQESLGALLETQTDREIAIQEQITFQEQQRAAEQQKELSRTQQEAEEERRLATASYQVQIAEQEQRRRIIEAEAEAQAIQIEAQAQAQAYQMIAEQIGASNAALVELLRIVGDRGINITPRVMVVGNGQSQAGNAETTALIGTMLDSMVSREEPETPARATSPRRSTQPASQPASQPSGN